MHSWWLQCRFVVLAIALACGAHAETGSGSLAEQIPSEHAKAQVGRLQEIRQLVQGGKASEAAVLIAAAKAESNGLAASDPRSMDGEEMQVALLASEGQFAQARPLSDRVVKARRGGSASEKLLLCWSLLQHVIVVDGAGDAASADRILQEAITAGGLAFPQGDKRRVQMLEAFADLFARGYNRPLAGIHLYEAAIQIRKSTQDDAPRELAGTLRKLALIEPPQGRDLSADSHLEQAIAILQRESSAAKDPADRAEVEADLGTLYGSRVGLAIRAQRFEDGRQLLAKARTHAANTPSAPYMDLWAAETDRREAEAKGDYAGAITAIRRGIATAKDLANDSSLVAGLELIEGRLQIETSDFAGAEITINRALKAFADAPTPEGAKTAEGWLLLARIERARGQEQRADRWVTAALAMMKTRRSEVPILFGTNRMPLPLEKQHFGAKPAPALSYGQALVLVPGTGPITGTGLSTLGGPTVLERLLVTNVKGLEVPELTEAAAARSRTAKLYPKTALVFVHGFGTTFEFALARAAQITRDIAFDGPAFSFTWPSLGRTDPFAYGLDEKAANASVDSFVTFLATVAGVSGAEKIHIVAHSMGNQILLKALSKIRSELLASGSGLSRKIGEVVFAAPDVAQTEFQSQTAALAGHKMTLYASAYDKALWISFLRNVSVRAGTVRFGLLSSGRPVITPGVDSIDVSDAGRDYFNANHDVYASNPYVANDLRRLLQSGERPPHRRSLGVLLERGRQPEQYWVFQLSASR